MSEILTHSIAGVGFSFYTPEEIQKISVKRITAPHVFDNLGQPIPNGLNDAALGPTEKFESCGTCHLNYKECAGHVGHIETSVPLYHPLLFNLLVKLMKGKCFNCHKFRVPHLSALKLLAKLRYLQVGLVDKAATVEQRIIQAVAGAKYTAQQKKKNAQQKKKKTKKKTDDSSSSSSSGSSSSESEESESEEELKTVDPHELVEEMLAEANQLKRVQINTSMALGLRQNLVRDFLRAVAGGKV